MTVRVYRSTDTSAPVLNGNAGSMTTLLDAVLVNGYGAQLPLGWTKAFTGSSLASYKQPAGTTNGFYLDVDDSAAGSSNAYFTRVRGFETMTALFTGTNMFPTSGQVNASGGWWWKSTETATGTAVSWVVVGTDKMFYLWIQTAAANTFAPGGNAGVMYCFGDILSYKPGDIYNTMINVSTSSGVGTISSFGVCSTSLTSVTNGHYMVRSYLQTGTSLNVSKMGDAAKSGSITFIGGGTTGNATSYLAYPNPVDANLYMSPIWIGEPSNFVLRGVMPGSYAPCHYRPVNTGIQFAGTGAFSGKTFEAFSAWDPGSGSTLVGTVLLEVSNTW
jgi:hypothetical protein